MSTSKQNKGNCAFCGREMTSGGMSKHLQSCPERQKAIQTAVSSKTTPQPCYHLLVRDAYSRDFWLHLEINGRSTLQDLDRYLRAIWLECCGHLSQFSVGGWRGSEIPMGLTLESVVAPGHEMTHIYDFGTSSETIIKTVTVRLGHPLTRHPITLMARNNLPEVTCAECGAAATWYCADCLVTRGEWINLCANHLSNHNHDEYGGPSPLINSPRLGMCGYDGPAEPPY